MSKLRNPIKFQMLSIMFGSGVQSVIPNMSIKTLLPLLLLCAINVGHSARILGIYPFPGRSHYNIARALFRGLAEKGHDLTVISAFEEKDKPQNGTYRDISLAKYFEEYSNTPENQNKEWNMFKRVGLNPFVGAYFVVKMTSNSVEKLLQLEPIQKLLLSDEKFDVVITDNFLSDAFKAFATHFDAPLIVFNPVFPNFWINPLVGNPSPPSYVPDVMSEYYPPMTFCERLTNSLLYVFNMALYTWYFYPKQNSFVQKYIPRGGDLNDILYNTSLVLLNSHPSLNEPVPMVPNMVEVGGLHMSPPKKLPQDLQEFFDNAKEGVIYFSMGSNLKSARFPEEKRNAFMNAFAKLKQQVLWKWEDDELPGLPPNVKLSKWVPQQDILAHPNLKLFITHGGFISSIETAYHGVPVLVVPIFGDQPLNAHFVYKNRLGRYIKYGDISEKTVVDNINEILSNPMYLQNSKKRSRLFHDRITNPLDTATYWVDYVIRHRGAPHLRVAGVDLPWYQYLLVDVILFITIVISAFAFLLYFVVTKIFKKKSSNKKGATKKVKRN